MARTSDAQAERRPSIEYGKSKMNVLKKLLKIVTHPATMVAAVVAGFVVGFEFKDFAIALKPYAGIYIALLSMCLLPVMVTALIWGIGQMLRAAKTRALFGRMAMIYGVGVLLPCAAGILIALIFQPGAQLGDGAAAALGGQISNVGNQDDQSGGLLAFVQSMIPPNIFGALSQGQFLSIVFFNILLGLALGLVRSPGADMTLSIVNSLYATFSLLFQWVLVPLPFGLFCIVASSMAEADQELLVALLTYVIYFYVAAMILFVLYIVAIAIAARRAPLSPLVDFKLPIILAFATDNAFVALYSAIESLQERFKVDREVADTIVPFGVLANQHGQILLFSFTAIFIAQVYQIDLGVTALLTIAIGTIVSGVAAVGGGPVLAPILAPVLIGAGVPDVLAFVILTTSQPAVARMSSTLTVLATCALAILTTSGSAGKTASNAAANSTK
jgi:proton glutamate symport protein